MSGLIASAPSKQYGSGGIVTRMSRAAMAMAASASSRSCAAMNCSTSSRSSALGSRADHSARRGGQVRLHRGPGPLQGAVGRGDAGAERRGGLAGRPAEHVAGDQRRALPRRQDLERGQERQRDRLPRDGHRLGLLVARRGRLEQQVRVGLQPRHLGERARRRSAGSCAGACPGRRWWRSGTARRGTATRRRSRTGRARLSGTSPAPRPRPRRTRPASGSSGRAAHAGAVRPGRRTRALTRDRRAHRLGMIHRQPLLRSTSCSSQMLPSGSAKSANDW